MSIAFRVDSSEKIGTGHLMRCLTLANALQQQGIDCLFFIKPATGDLIEWVESLGYKVIRLLYTENKTSEPSLYFHQHWLSGHWKDDAMACHKMFKDEMIQCLVVDHYALDERWERCFNAPLLVIDDLADRSHYCQFLLDQTHGRLALDYLKLIPENCKMLLGCDYALLRPEFIQWRSVSLARRLIPQVKRILISLGGVDKDNMTQKVLDALNLSSLSNHCQIEVVLGRSSPHIEQIKAHIKKLRFSVNVVSGVNDMAKRMTYADLAIGAAGSTSWERCSLGLPTLMLVLADNQQLIATQLQQIGVAKVLEQNQMAIQLTDFFNQPDILFKLSEMSKAALHLMDGRGTERIVRHILDIIHSCNIKA